VLTVWRVGTVGQVGLTEQMLEDGSVTTHVQPVWLLRNTPPAHHDLDWNILLAQGTQEVKESQ